MTRGVLRYIVSYRSEKQNLSSLKRFKSPQTKKKQAKKPKLVIWSFGCDVIALIKLSLTPSSVLLPSLRLALLSFSLRATRQQVGETFLVCGATFKPVDKETGLSVSCLQHKVVPPLCVCLFPMRVNLTLHWDPRLIVMTTVPPPISPSFPHQFSHRTRPTLCSWLCVCLRDIQVRLVCVH